MCYSGRCKYEMYGGPDVGDCTLTPQEHKHLPDDAMCSDVAQDNMEQDAAEEKVELAIDDFNFLD